MTWFLKIGLCLIITSLVLEVIYCFARPMAYTDKSRKVDDVWNCIFGSSLSCGIVSCLIGLCGIILTSSFM